MRQFEVMIIGAGAVGNAIAREISKMNKVSVGVLEKEPDTAFGISGRNSGVLHAGFNNKPGSLMAKLCVEGSEGFSKEAEELGVAFKRTGKLIIARFDEDMGRLLKLKEQGEASGVRELKIIGQEELERLTGYEAGVAALWSGMTGIFDPFEYTVALAKAAVSQGAEYFFGRKVNAAAVSERGNGFQVTAENLATEKIEHYHAKILINSAGLYADEISRMAGIDDYRIFPCRGEYHILEKRQSKALELPIYPIPNEKEGGLGVHLTPTIHGNIMIGPSAEYLEPGQDREDYSTTGNVMDKLREEGIDLFPNLIKMDCIRSFSGIRPKLASAKEGGYADFVIEESNKVPGLIQLIGIESPGLTSSIPIGKMVAKLTEGIITRNRDQNGYAEDKTSKATDTGYSMDPAAHSDLGIAAKSKYNLDDKGDQKMLCRCEGITEAAILEAYDNILKIGAIPTVKGLKNRARVTMGNCQGSFCIINIIELLEKKRQLDPFKLLWNGFGSRMFDGRVKE